MVSTRSMAAVPPPKRKAKAAQRKSKSKSKAAASSSEELKRMAAALSAVDVAKILRVKQEAMEAIKTKCFPSLAKARAAMLAAAGPGAAVAEPEKKKKKKVVKYLVPQSYIDHMKEDGLFHCVDEIPEDRLALKSQVYLEEYQAKMLLTEKLQACQQVLLDQYDVIGYAYDVKEVTDDEGEDEVEN